MEDYQIVNLYWARQEQAIEFSDQKYGRMLRSMSQSLLDSRQDAEECVNDTYLDAWNAMPTARPDHLGAFLSKITRRISIDRYRTAHRQKRGGEDTLTEELCECVPDSDTVEKQYQNQMLSQALDRFLASLTREKRVMFIRRYFFSASIAQISVMMQLSESKVKVTLHRTREALRNFLEKEGLL